MNKMIRGSLAAIIMLTTSAFGLDSAQAPTLEWQRIDLEERLQGRIAKAVSTVVQEKHFVVNVSIALKPLAPVAKAKEAEKKLENKKVVAKTVTALADENRVTLGKLDLDLPEFDERPEQVQKAQEVVVEGPKLFESIASVVVTVLLDNSVSDAKRDIVRKIAERGSALVGTSQAEIKMEKAELETPVVQEAPAPWDLKRWVIEMKIPIGFLLATLLVCIAVLSTFGGYKKLETRKISLLEAQGARQETSSQSGGGAAPQPEQQQHAPESAPSHAAGHARDSGSSHSDVQMDGVQKGFEKFKDLLKQSPERAATLIKQWIRSPVKGGASEALALLPQVLSTEELLSTFNHLNLDDRKEWRKLLGNAVDPAGASMAETYISSQIVESVMLPPLELENDLRQLISDLKLRECISISTAEPSLGAVLTNLLPTAQVGRILALLPSEVASEVTMASLKLSHEEIRAKAGALKDAIMKIKSKSSAVEAPFIDRAAELLQQVGPTKEGSIFRAMAESGEHEVLEAIAREFFPAELLLKLPTGLLKTLLDKMPLAKRAELIVSRDESEQSLMLDCLGKSGTKMRDLIDAEVAQVTGDELRKKRVEKNVEGYWKEFVELGRAYINGNEIATSQAEGVLGGWLSEKTQGKTGGGSGAAA